jgi:transposase
MKKRNIFQNQSQEILTLFETAKDRSKVMCIPMDYAKKDHVAMFCNGNGKILRKPFSIKNTPEGVEYLIDQVTRSCRHHGINIKHTLFGGEDCGTYANNFIEALRSENWLVAGVNALDAKRHRENVQASTDRLDLLGISKMLLNCRGNCSPAQSGIYWNLRTLCRERQKLVVTKSGVKNRVHTIVDQIFPGFLNETKSGIPPFSQASLILMEDRFSVHQIRRRRPAALVKILAKQGLPNPESRAEKLQRYAAQVLNPQKDHIVTLQLSLKQQVKLILCLQESTDQLQRNIAAHLAQVPGAFLTTIRGIGLILAAGVSAEIGDPNKQGSLTNLVSYAGIIPQIKQTGGEQGKTQVIRVGKRCNRILKNYVVQAGLHMGIHGPDELIADYKRRAARDQHADFGMARRFLRMAMCLMRTHQAYLPKRLGRRQCLMEERARYYQGAWPLLMDKWRRVKMLDIAFDKKMPLGQWRNMIQELYGIKLSL